MQQSNSQYQVTNAARKLHLLKALVENRSLLTIIVLDMQEAVTSALIEVDRDRIVLDELIPHSANLAFNPESSFSVITKLKGIPIRFQSTVVSIDPAYDGITSYICRLPETVDYQQKRRDYRLGSRGAIWPSILVSAVEESMDVRSEEDDNDLQAPQVPTGDEPVPGSNIKLAEDSLAPSFSGKITDISIGGANAEFAQLPEWAEQNKTIACTIELNDGPMIFTRARICHLQQSVKGRRKTLIVNIGMEFLSLNEINRKQIQRWIFNSERKRLRQ